MELSAGAVVVRRETGGWKYLVLRAYRNWDFPKGTVEQREEPLECARREVAEETGIGDLRFPWGDSFRETEPYRNGRKVARYYLAETSERELTLPVSPELGRPEHHEYRWVPGGQLAELLPARMGPVIEWARKTVEHPGGGGVQ